MFGKVSNAFLKSFSFCRNQRNIYTKKVTTSTWESTLMAVAKPEKLEALMELILPQALSGRGMPLHSYWDI